MGLAHEPVRAGYVFDGVPETHDVDLAARDIQRGEIADQDIRAVGASRMFGGTLRNLDALGRVIKRLGLVEKEAVGRADFEQGSSVRPVGGHLLEVPPHRAAQGALLAEVVGVLLAGEIVLAVQTRKVDAGGVSQKKESTVHAGVQATKAWSETGGCATRRAARCLRNGGDEPARSGMSPWRARSRGAARCPPSNP